ncbi:hypothetical protein [Streptomyces adustus]|uniref:hypothetical protein n=1 Tax=Streptomyces adustus TaxID=1609272 RepID=UPI00371B0FB3
MPIARCAALRASAAVSTSRPGIKNTVSALSRHRMGIMARCAVWAVGVSVFLLLVPVLRAAPTCRPVVR